ncbi:sialidase family protein [Arthrobacter sulfonylureivorans]|uniref:sialidase family protein n=1 Tax=Arthrobacter sulfonylureivorans TaxID=2486855 RepID=UPI0039E2FDAE
MEQVLAVRGVGGYRRYRAPALAVAPSGSVIAAYAGLDGQGGPPRSGDLLLRRSFDGGSSWEPQQVLWAGHAGQTPGRPGLLSDAVTGRILMAFVARDKAGSAETVAADAARRFELMSSDDDGATWQHRTVTPRLASDTITGLDSAGSGTGVHTGPFAGRLLVQFAVTAEGGRPGAASGYSDDHGDSWTVGEPLKAPNPGPAVSEVLGASEALEAPGAFPAVKMTEPDPDPGAAACLADGRVLLHLSAAPNRWAAFSDDGGHSYGPLHPVEELADSGSPGSLIRFDGLPALGGLAAQVSRHWLLAANCQDPVLNRNVVLSLSRDDGESWPHKLTIWRSGASAPAVVRLADGRIGVLYERQGSRELVYATADPGMLRMAWPRGAVTRKASAGSGGTAHETGPLPVVGDYPLRFDMVLQAILSTDKGLPEPGYRAGDMLLFAGRAQVMGSQFMSVQLSGTFDNAEDFPPRELGPGAVERYLHPVHTVTAADVAAGSFTLAFTCSAAPVNGASGSAPEVARRREFRLDVVSGEISEG